MRARGCGLLLLLALMGCSDAPAPTQPPVPTPTASPTPGAPPGVTVGAGSGPTQIVFSASQPSPGAIITGCGPDISGCEGRLRLRFLLRPSRTGHALGFHVFLHDTRLQACLLAETGPFELRANEDLGVEVVLDDSQRCATPTTIATMAAVVEGTVEVASRQEWGATYTFQ